MCRRELLAPGDLGRLPAGSSRVREKASSAGGELRSHALRLRDRALRSRPVTGTVNRPRRNRRLAAVLGVGLAVAGAAYGCAGAGSQGVGVGGPGAAIEGPGAALAGGAGDVAGEPLAEPDANGWVRRIRPFPVMDSAGVAYENPFLGGFNVPRPQWVDIDADGDLDLFVQERTGHLLFFEREDGPEGPVHTWRPGTYDHLDVGEWYRFVDVDGDGDRDLLSESPFSYVRLFRNAGDLGEARFELLADTLRDVRGDAIYSDRQNIPNATDIDCDGLLDLFLGRTTGVVTRYEATRAFAASAAPFRHVTDRFEEIEIVADPVASGATVPRTTRHGANTMAFADYDADGDADLFWGDFFEPGLLLIRNTGSCASPNFRSEPSQFPLKAPVITSGYNAPTFGDYDGDGDVDLLMGVLGGSNNANTSTVDNLYLFTQEEGGDWTRRSSAFVRQVDVGAESVPTLVDLDSDGDLDLLLGHKIDPTDLPNARVFLFENEGSAVAPVLRWKGGFPLEGAYHNAPAFGDLDADGDLDLILGTWRNELRFLRNEGTRWEPRFELVDSAFIEITRGSNTTPTLGDLDGDGDLDLLVGESSGTLNYFENVGSSREPDFEMITDEYLDVDVGRRSFPKLVDLDGDGDLDLVVGTEESGILYFQNHRASDGRNDFRLTESPFPSPAVLPRWTTPELADIDGDGDLDLITGGDGGGVYYFERRR